MNEEQHSITRQSAKYSSENAYKHVQIDRKREESAEKIRFINYSEDLLSPYRLSRSPDINNNNNSAINNLNDDPFLTHRTESLKKLGYIKPTAKINDSPALTSSTPSSPSKSKYSAETKDSNQAIPPPPTPTKAQATLETQISPTKNSETKNNEDEIQTIEKPSTSNDPLGPYLIDLWPVNSIPNNENKNHVNNETKNTENKNNNNNNNNNNNLLPPKANGDLLMHVASNQKTQSNSNSNPSSASSSNSNSMTTSPPPTPVLPRIILPPNMMDNPKPSPFQKLSATEALTEANG